ncbi:MAG: ABC transporter substrate-binding protein [Negativicutes bacterium]|nr:ABC transporter substrate-binding protein [Negativicutes bacterium]
MLTVLRPAMQKLIACLCCLFILPVSGCTRQEQPVVPGSKDLAAYLTVTDDAGRTVVLKKKPERIVVLSTSFLELLYAVDGQAIGRPSSRTADIPEKARSLPEVGFVYNINTEKVLALQPDLVIAFQGIHERLIPLLESSNVPVILLKMKSYEDVIAKVKLFSEIAGTKEKGSSLVRVMDNRLKAVKDKLPQSGKKVAILHATAKSVTLELESSIAGGVAKLLKLQNVAVGSRPLDSDMDATPYSLEKLVEQNPDLILVVTMGQSPEIAKRLKADVESNPAWATLRAVRDNQVFFLPPELFLLHPGVRMPDAVEYMAKLVYPEVYK